MTLYSLHSVELFLSSAIGLNSPINSRRLLDDIDFISLYIHLILSLIINHHDNGDQAAKRFYRDPQYTKYFKQECIPVGCVPSAVVAVCWGGLPGGGVSAWWRGGVCLGGAYLRGVSQHSLRQTHPLDRILDTHFWQYYLAITSLRTVITMDPVSFAVVRFVSYTGTKKYWYLAGTFGRGFLFGWCLETNGWLLIV